MSPWKIADSRRNAQRRPGHESRTRRSTRRPLRLELLENRTLLSKIDWVGTRGGGDGSSWNDPSNWNPDGVPTSDDIVLIGKGTDVVIGAGVEASSEELTDEGSLDIEAGGALSITNEVGKLTKSSIDGALVNGGKVDLQGSVELELFGGGTGSGTFSGGFAFERGTYTLQQGASCDGASMYVVGGALDITGNVSFGDLSLASGTFSGNGELTVVDSMDWSGGSIQGTGLFLQIEGSLTMYGGDVLAFANGQIDIANGATVYDASGSVEASGGAVWNDLPGSNFIVDGSSVTFDEESGATFNNAGEFDISAPGMAATFVGDFTNTGIVDIQAGTLSIQGQYVQASGCTDLEGNTLTLTGGVDLEGGCLTGPGTIASDLTNAGQVSPGATGILTVAGNYNQEAAGSLNIAVGGYVSGTQFDQLEISDTGSATLAGSLNVRLVDGFMPNPGDAFQIMTFGSRSGEFDQVAESFQPVYGTEDLTLVAQSATETTLSSEANPSVYGQSLTVTADVTAVTPGGGTPTGTIQFEVDGTDYGDPVSMSGGSASLTTAATELTAGSHIITAKYSGDSNLAASDGSQTETVNQAVLTVSGITASNKIYDGTTTAALDTSGAALVGVIGTDDVTLDRSGATGSFASPDVANEIAVTIAGLTIGGAQASDYTLTQPTTTANITAATTTTTVASDTNPSVAGQPVTFTATVAAGTPADRTPTGNVTFYDGEMDLATVDLDAGGQASLTTAVLAAGAHMIKVDYNGDDNFAGGTSNGIAQEVSPPLNVYVSGSYAGDAPGTQVMWIDGTKHYFGADAFGTIQDGVNAVAVGGTVNVAPGTYSEAVTIPNELTLAGAVQNSLTPVLDGTGKAAGSAGITIAAADVAISDLTIQGFTGAAGIDVAGGSFADLAALVITGNGTGVLVEVGGTVAVNLCTIAGNSTRDSGGGIDNDGTVTVTGGTITGNSAQHDGGGIQNVGNLCVTGCTISLNSASSDGEFGSGGGIDNRGTVMITDCTMLYNSADGGGGVCVEQGGTATVTGCTVTDNSASDGGGIQNIGVLTVVGGTISLNSASDGGDIGSGGGIDNLGTAAITSATINYNSAYDGGGIRVEQDSSATVTACTILYNTFSAGGDIDNNATLTVSGSSNTGDYNQTAGGVLNMNIGGPAPGTDYDQLNFLNQATFDGTLNITLINGFSPMVPSSFQVVTFGSVVGKFATINGLKTCAGAFMVPVYYPTSLTLVAAYTPAQIRTAYGINSLDADGTGQTIAIVVAYDDPNIFEDVDAFDNQFGTTSNGPTLLTEYGIAASFLTVLDQTGGSSLPDIDHTGTWEGEEMLDVEWAHAIAPGAKIVVVECNSAFPFDLDTGRSTAAGLSGVSVVSMSSGGPESSASDESRRDSIFTTPIGHQGVTFVAAAGDTGSPGDYPAYSPNVLAVGGTSLTVNADGSYNSETAWNRSGGGRSQFEAQPVYQNGVVPTTMSTVGGVANRTTPDVAFDADGNTGVAEFDSYNAVGDGPVSWTVGDGTSLGAPCWAGLIALADQLRVAAGGTTLDGVSQTLPGLYALPARDFNDITSGSNGTFHAGPGYDMVTGLGSPVANLLVPDLADLVSTTTTTLTSNLPTAVYGQQITFMATVKVSFTGAGTIAATGTVDFFDTTTNKDLGSYPVNTNGVASVTTLALSAGVHIITATYERNDTLLSSSADLAQFVTRATLTVTGVTASNKVYDGTTTATLNASTAALAGVFGTDDVTLDTSAASGTFASKDVGTGIAVTIAGLAIGGAQASDYTLTQPTATANITAAALSVSGITAKDKVYDGTTTATLDTSAAALVGVIGTDVVTLGTSTATGTFASADVGDGITVTIAGLKIGGAQAFDYTLTQPTTTADITPAALTVSGITADDKVYDGTTTATLDTSATGLEGVIGDDDVTLDTSGATGTFASRNVGTGITVTIAGLEIGGDQASDYTLTQPTTTADITPAPLTITADNKTRLYGTANPMLTASYSGLVSGDTPASLTKPPSLSTSATISSPVGAYPIVVSGAVDPNYTITYKNGTLTVVIGYTPQQIRQAYGFDQITFANRQGQAIAGDGRGQTIAIVDAYDDPALVDSTAPGFSTSDLAQFDQHFGLPDPPSFIKLGQDGSANLPGPDPTGVWEGEEALDLEWAHAIAPEAKIILVETNFNPTNLTQGFQDLFAGVATAASLPGVSVVSMSWGYPESFFGQAAEHNYDTTVFAGHPGVSFVAGSGDSGAPGIYPAASPYVVAVGGTSLLLNADNSYNSEQGWSGSGGGASPFESEPAYQDGVQNTGFRTIPDVAYDADPSTGFYVFNSQGGGGLTVVGGTSAGTPQWAALVAIVDQGLALGGKGPLDGPTQTLPALYRLPSSDFHDITTGNNGGYSAGPGYDLVTGLGSPVANRLVADLVNSDTLSVTAATVSAIEGQQFQGTVATFAVADPVGVTGSFTAAIDWGNGQPVAGTVTFDSTTDTFVVSGAYTFAEEGTYTITVTVHDANGNTAVGAGQAVVADAPLTDTTPASNIITVPDAGNRSTGTVVLATFTDGNPLATANDYVISVNWIGAVSGTTSDSVQLVSASATSSSWEVLGSASYAAPGAYPVIVTVTDKGGINNTFTDTNTIIDVDFATPALNSIAPGQILAGYPNPLTLAVSGSAFYPQSIVDWNGAALSTTYVSPTELSASIPASKFASAGNTTITVTNPAPGGGISNSVTFQVVEPASVYVNSAWAGDAAGTPVTWTDGSTHDFGEDAFGTIQAGVNAVALGGTVSVALGTYSEAVTIAKSLTLAGTVESSVDPVLDGTGLNSSAAGITINAGNVTISNLTVQNFSGSGIDVAGGTAMMTGSTLSHNSAPEGGGINNSGVLTLTDCTVSGNQATNIAFDYQSANGGGIWNGGTMTLTDCTISGNVAGGSYVGYDVGNSGGGIYNIGTMRVASSNVINDTATGYTSSGGGGIYNGGTMFVTTSTVSHDLAGAFNGCDGGGIVNQGAMTLTNSTIADNMNVNDSYEAHCFGGGIFSDGTLTVINCTIAGNSSYGSGGGIYCFGETLLDNTIVALNTFYGYGPDDIFGTVDPASAYNLIGAGGSGGLTNSNGNQVGVVDPGLDPNGLQDNGGPTQTIALVAGSPAIDAGSNSLAVDPTGNPLQYDQRGTGYPRIEGSAVDIGAFEFHPTPAMDTTPPTSHVVNSLGTSQTSDSFPVSVAFNDPPGSGGSPDSGVTSVDLYVSVDNGPFSLYRTQSFAATASGTVSFTFVGQDRNLYAFHSVAHDAAGNTESKSDTAIEASTSVPDLNPPVTHILASSPSYSWNPFASSEFSGLNPSSYSNGVFTINWAGADPDQNTGVPAGSIALVNIYVQVDGGAPVLIGQPAGGTPNGNGIDNGSITYSALADGLPHTYSFDSVGVDDEQMKQYAPQAGPAAPDLTFSNVTYAAPLGIQTLVVEDNIAERSFLQYLDVDFNQSLSNEPGAANAEGRPDRQQSQLVRGALVVRREPHLE